MSGPISRGPPRDAMPVTDPFQSLRTRLISTILGHVFLGIQTTLSGVAVHHLWSIRHLPRRTVLWSCIFIAAVWLTYALHTAWAVSVLLVFYRFQITPRYLNNMFAILTAFTATSTTLADGLLTFRCWIIWDRSWLLLIPACLLACNFVLSLVTIGLFSMEWLTKRPADARIIVDVSISLSLALNVLLASAAITRLLQLRHGLRQLTRATGNHYLPVAHILALTAVLWTAGSALSMAFRLSEVSLAIYSCNLFLFATSPLLIFLHLGQQSPRVVGASIPGPSALSSTQPLWTRVRARKSMAEVLTIDEALKIPESEPLSGAGDLAFTELRQAAPSMT